MVPLRKVSLASSDFFAKNDVVFRIGYPLRPINQKLVSFGAGFPAVPEIPGLTGATHPLAGGD